MKPILAYPSSQKHLAIQCQAVANFCKIPIDTNVDDGAKKITLKLGPDIALRGTSSICFFLDNFNRESNDERRKISKNLQQSRFIQWSSFVTSELSSYPPNSKQMENSLNFLESRLTESEYLSGPVLNSDDIFVGFNLLLHPSQIFSKFSKVSAWLENVQSSCEPWSSYFKECLKSESIKVKDKPKKEPKKKGSSQKDQSKEEKKRKLKVLCIHGYRQNAKTAKEKLGSFRKLVSKFADLEFITAPHLIPSDLPEEQDQYGWWFSQTNKTFDAHEETKVENGFQESIQLISETLKREAAAGTPYDGIFSFSQGASLAAYYCVMQEMGNLDVCFRFCVLVAGFVSRTQNHRKVFEDMVKVHQKKVSIPTLHVFGDTDRVIEKDMSEELLQYFSNVDTLKHAGGHFVPASGQEKKTFVNFFEKMQNALAE